MINVQQIFNCTEINNVFELYFVSEIGKYLYLNYDETLSLKNVRINPELESLATWDILRLAIKNGYIMEIDIPSERYILDLQFPLKANRKELVNVYLVEEEVPFNREESNKRKEDLDYHLMNPMKRQFSITSKTDNDWVMTIYGENNRNFTVNNYTFNMNIENLNHQVWCSFIAYIVVKRYKEGIPNTLKLVVDRQILGGNNTAMNYVYLLFDRTDALAGWCTILFDKNVDYDSKLKAFFNAWYQIGKDLGYTRELHSTEDKRNFMQKIDMQEGDVVVFYEKGKQTENITKPKMIEKCNIAIIDSITNSNITLRHIFNHKTRTTAEVEWADKTMAVKDLYNYECPYLKVTERVETMQLVSIGIGNLIYKEDKFIVPLDDADDALVQYVSREKDKIDKIYLTQNELIYWVFKDFNIQFDETRFLERYFPNQTPLYTRYMNGEDISEWYVN